MQSGEDPWPLGMKRDALDAIAFGFKLYTHRFRR